MKNRLQNPIPGSGMCRQWRVTVLFAVLGLMSGARALSAPPDWTVDPTRFQYNLSLTAAVLVNDSLTADTSNIIGAFVGNECRGRSQAVLVGNRVVWFTTVFSNAAAGEIVTLKAYVAAWDMVIPITENLRFVGDAQVGTPVVPFAVHALTEPGYIVITAARESGWNMLSLPLTVRDPRRTTVFPWSLSSAYLFDGGYRSIDSIGPGGCYWMKYPADTLTSLRVLNLAGVPRSVDTINVQPGWNMLGSVCKPVATTSVTAIGTTTISSYYAYRQGYIAVDTLRPGLGCWIKVNAPGKLVLQVPAR